MIYSEVLTHFQGVEITKQGTEAKAQCPICGKEKHCVITFDPKTEKTMIHCVHCNETAEHIAPSVGLTLKDLFVNQTATDKTKAEAPRIVRSRTHDYTDEKGEVVARKEIHTMSDGGKRCNWKRIEKGTVTSNRLSGYKVPLYNTKGLAENTTDLVIFAEGEKDADTLCAMGYTGTTTPNGGMQNTWQDKYNDYIADKHIVIICDNDETGKKYGKTVADRTLDIAKSVKVIEASDIMPQIKEKGDITDIVDIIGIDKAKKRLEEAIETTAFYIKKNRFDDTSKKASEFDILEREFLWYPYIPVGEYTTLTASGGTGKSMLTCLIAAHLTTGKPLLSEREEKNKYNGTPSNVLFISAEDDGNAYRERLEKCGADIERCTILDCESSLGISLVNDANELTEFIKQHKFKAVFIDPWFAFLGGDIDMNRINAVRPVFQTISNIAKKSDCSIVLMTHTNKGLHASNINNASMGSADFINAARSSLQLTSLTPDEKKNSRVMVHTKVNHASLGKSIEYEITDEKVSFVGFNDIDLNCLEKAAASRGQKRPDEILIDIKNAPDHKKELIEAVVDLCADMEKGDKKTIVYEDFIEKYGDLFTGTRKKCIESIATYVLDEYGVIIENKKLKVKKEDGNMTTKWGIEIKAR